MMTLEIITPPAIEPVTLEEAKAHCRIDHTDEDDLLSALIISSRRLCENFCQCAFISQTWEISFDLKDDPTCRDYINLPYGEIQSITSIKTYDQDNVATVFSSAAYRTSHKRVVLNDNYSWPTLYRKFESMVIRYVVGFGATADDIPQDIRQAILMTIAHFYENRETVTDPFTGTNQTYVMLPFGVPALLQPYKIFAI